MFLKQLELTTALRPSYLPDEVLLFVQDHVGLYEGKNKQPSQQDGQVYLTSHRVCYVDKADPRRQSVALDLKDVERYEYYAGFIKSSPKITLIPKPMNRSSFPRTASHQRNGGPSRPPAEVPGATTWICTICSFPNPVPSNFEPSTANAHTPLPPCLSCGIKPSLTHVLKAAISCATSRKLPESPRSKVQVGLPPAPAWDAPPKSSDPDASFQCPRCTFLNHPFLLSCEICGAPLISHDVPPELTASPAPRDSAAFPGPMLNPLPFLQYSIGSPDSVRISFRRGGDKIFFERLKGSMTQRKWLLHGAPPAPTANDTAVAAEQSHPRIGGIAGLEQRGQAMRRNNERVIGSAFEDLEALMASAKDVVALAESFRRQVKGGGGENELLAVAATSQLGLATTRDIVSSSADDSLYLSELARNVAEFLTEDARGYLRRAGGVVSLVDLWAAFNRARGGVELVSPLDFEKAARLWETLQLPVRLRTFKSGVMVVQSRDRTDEATIRALTTWMRGMKEKPPEREVVWDWRIFGRGVTAQDTAERFGWSIGVAEEELEMAEERGVLCREEGVEGLKFWENLIDTGEGQEYRTPAQREHDSIMRTLKETGLL